MKILIITELYPDDSPVKTTNAVHDLARFWTDEHEVVCVKEEWLTLSLSKEKRLRGMKPEIYRKQLASLFISFTFFYCISNFILYIYIYNWNK